MKKLEIESILYTILRIICIGTFCYCSGVFLYIFQVTPCSLILSRQGNILFVLDGEKKKKYITKSIS